MKKSLIISLLALLIVFACGSVLTASAEKVVTIGYKDDFNTLDPANMASFPDWPIGTAIYSALVDYKPGLSSEVEGDLAESWEWSDDNLVLTFHLRSGFVWSDGSGEVTADDVKYTFDRIKNPETGSQYQGDMKLLNHIDVIDKYTVSFFFDEPYAPFLNAVCAWRPGLIVNKAAMEAKTDDYNSHPVGSGAYILESWIPKTEIVLVKNYNHPDAAKYNIDKYIYKIIPETLTAAMALQNKDIDILYVKDLESDNMLSKIPTLNKQTIAGNNIIKMYFNYNFEPFQNKLVRQAILHAIDKEAIVEFVIDGMGTPAKSEIPPFMAGYSEDLPEYEYNPEKGKELLAEAGYPDGFTMHLIVDSWGNYPRIAEAVPDMLAEIGITCELEVVESSAIAARYIEGSYDAYLMGMGRLDAHQLLYAQYHSVNHPPAGQNRSYLSDPVLDELIMKQITTTEVDARNKAIEDICYYMRDNALDVPILVENITLFTQDYIHNMPASNDMIAWYMIDTTK